MDTAAPTRTAEYLTRVADANGESLSDLLRSTGIDLRNVESITLSHLKFLEDNYAANAGELVEAVLSDAR